MKAIIAGGGTAGHLFPGIAVAREILRRHPGSEILFVGADQGIETRIVPKEGFALQTLSVGGLKGMGWMQRIRNAVGMVMGIMKARHILSEFQPDVVVGVGGYASFPVLGAATLSGRPRIVMEQNAIPGLANRVLGKRAQFAAVTDPRTVSFFGDRGVVTGNPVRPEFKSIAAKKHIAPYTVLIFGGSQGARAINRAVIDALRQWSDWKDRLRFVHQTGEHEIDEVTRAYAEAGFSADVRSFFNQFHEQYIAADLIISRAGATTVAEIKAAGRAAILIPFPFAADDHQTKNAQAMVDEHAAVLISNADLSGTVLASSVRRMLSDIPQLEEMEGNARRLAILDAESRIVDLVDRAAMGGSRRV